MALRPDNGKVLAINAWLQDNQALPYAMDHRDEDISLAEFTAKGIELLQDDPDGFFLMIEGGKIDWACHANDGAAAIHDTFAFDQSIEEAYRFYQAHPQDTLIVVTGDHECGGMTLGFAGTKYVTNFEVLSKQRVSFQKFDHQIAAQFKESEATFADVKPIITKYFGLKFDAGPGDPLALASHELTKIHTSFERYVSRDIEKSNDPNTYLLYGGYNPLSITLTHILNQKAGIGWTSYKHTGVPVCTSAIGVDSETFNGSYDNTDIARKIMRAMELEPQVASSSHTKKDSATAHSYGNGCIRSGGLSQRGAACLISGVL
jgi:alkaline phosphatase